MDKEVQKFLEKNGYGINQPQKEYGLRHLMFDIFKWGAKTKAFAGLMIFFAIATTCGYYAEFTKEKPDYSPKKSFYTPPEKSVFEIKWGIDPVEYAKHPEKYPHVRTSASRKSLPDPFANEVTVKHKRTYGYRKDKHEVEILNDNRTTTTLTEDDVYDIVDEEMDFYRD